MKFYAELISDMISWISLDLDSKFTHKIKTFLDPQDQDCGTQNQEQTESRKTKTKHSIFYSEEQDQRLATEEQDQRLATLIEAYKNAV